MSREEKIHIRHCILYEFQRGNNASVASENLCRVFGEDSVTTRTTQRWFSKFRTGDFSLQDEPRSGRPAVRLEQLVKKALEQDPTQKLKDDCNKKIRLDAIQSSSEDLNNN